MLILIGKGMTFIQKGLFYSLVIWKRGKMKSTFIIFVLFLLIGCKKSNKADILMKDKNTEEVKVVSEEVEVIETEYLYEINDNNVRFREYPKLENNIIREFTKGEMVSIIGRSLYMESIGNNTCYWLMVETPDKEIGWVYEPFIDYDESEINDINVLGSSFQLLHNDNNKIPYELTYNEDTSVGIIFKNNIIFYDDNNEIINSEILNNYLKENEIIRISLSDYYSESKIIRIVGHDNVFVNRNDIVVLPGAVEIIDGDYSSEDKRFYNIYKTPGIEQFDKIASSDPFYGVHDIQYFNKQFFLNISTYGNISGDGWISYSKSKPMVDFSRCEYIKGNSFLFVIPNRINDIKSMFGEPKNILTRYTKNRHSGEEDIISLLQYDGLVIEVYHATEIDKYLIISIRVMNENLPVQSDIKIGTDINNIIGILGEPSEIRENRYIFKFYSDFEDIGYLSILVNGENKVEEIAHFYFLS